MDSTRCPQLEQNKLPGLGYETLSEIPEIIKRDTGIAENFSGIYEEYGMEYAESVLKEALIL